MISRDQIAHGIAEYIRQDLIPTVPDPLMDIALDTAARMLLRDAAMVDRVLSANVLPIFVPACADGYEIDPALEALADSLRERNGSIPLVVPAIRILKSDEKTLTFRAADVDRLRQRIGG